MADQLEVVICLGSSCFARGNKQLVQIVKKYLDDHNLMHKLKFRGKHCFGNCEHGPGMMIGQKRFEHLDSEMVLEILERELL